MSRRQGAYATFTPWQLPPELAGMAARVLDLSVPMQRISYLARDEARERLERGGDGDWPELAPATVEKKGSSQPGIGKHGGFGPSILPFWSFKNAGWSTRAPHAHLFARGTVRHISKSGERVFVFSQGRRHINRAESRKRLIGSHGESVQPPRPFDYLSDALEAKAFDIIGDYVVGEDSQ